MPIWRSSVRLSTAVPLDPFDGKSFRYDPKRRVVYSVGKNLVDNGGSAMPLKGKPSDPELRRRHNAEDAVTQSKPCPASDIRYPLQGVGTSGSIGIERTPR